MRIFEQMRKERQRAQATGSELACVLFWCWVWFAWVGLALFIPLSVIVLAMGGA